MRSQKATLAHGRVAPALGLALLALAWCLAQALALEHRVAHAPGLAAHGPHLVGGEHEEDESFCRLVDQAGLGDTLPLAASALASCWVGFARSWAAPVPVAAAGSRHGYEARAPPLG
jgi:hypothetical protein